MISFISSWAEQIVLAVVVATIIELILPKNKNKKYIQMVIGVYVLFNILIELLFLLKSNVISVPCSTSYTNHNVS